MEFLMKTFKKNNRSEDLPFANLKPAIIFNADLDSRSRKKQETENHSNEERTRSRKQN
jgi:hypothetical protein